MGFSAGENPNPNQGVAVEKKNVYVRACEIVCEMPQVLELVRNHDKKLADQMKRACQSVLLNIAEGRGNKEGNAKLRFATACGSAKEVRAALTIAREWGYIPAKQALHLDARLDPVCAITWCLSR